MGSHWVGGIPLGRWNSAGLVISNWVGEIPLGWWYPARWVRLGGILTVVWWICYTRGMKYVTMTVLLVLSSFASASAHGLWPFTGAWALATNTGDSCVALTNGTVWVKNSRVWRPGGASQSGDSEISFRLVDDPSQTYHHLPILGRRDLDWLSGMVLEEDLAMKKDYRLCRFVDEQYDRLTRNQLEKIFCCPPDDAYEKQVVVEAARERF